MSEMIDRPVVLWEIEKLIPYDKNAKNHPKDQVKKLAASIRQFGWANAKAIEVDASGVIINGHGRRLAALELGLKKVPVVVRDDLSPEQVRAYRLVDNKVAESTYDTDLLAGELFELSELTEADFDMSQFFSEREMNFMLDDLGAIDMSEISGGIEAEVKSHSENTEQAIANADDKQVPLHEVFGFKTVTIAQSRKLNLLKVHIEAITGLTGPDALITYAEQVEAAL